jgi:hypothetical protein
VDFGDGPREGKSVRDTGNVGNVGEATEEAIDEEKEILRR